jgi:hypothetical protein
MPTPNFIKYSTTPDGKSIKIGNYSIGVASGVTYGPTSDTSYWSGISPPTSGYTIYENKVANGPSIRVPVNSVSLIDYANRLYSGSSITTEAGALVYFNSLGNVICVNINYEEIVTSGLTVNLDAGFTPSYPKSGSTWGDLSFSGNNGTLVNGPTYNSSNGGTIVFDGTNDYCDISATQMTSNLITISGFIKWVAGTGGMFFGFTTYDVWTQSGNLGYNVGASDVYGISSATVTSLGLIGNWAHYTFVMTNTGSIPTNNKIYINGNLQTLAQRLGTTGNAPGFGSNLRLCSWNAGGFYGNLQYGNLQVYNRALSQAEILQNFNTQKARFGL